MKHATLVLGALALLLAGSGLAKADFMNPSFETGDLSGWGGTATTDGYGLNPFGTTYGAGMDGKYWMWLAGYEIDRTLTQTVGGLTAGKSYKISFIMASEYVNSDSLNLSVDGGPATLFTAPPYIPGGFNGGFWDNWVSKSYTFTASGATAFVEFSSFGLNASGYDVGLDNVHIAPATSAAPEPASLTLLGIGAVGMLGYGWRRRKQQVA